ncbi:serine hydrolase domain-containing protein [Enterococcus dispar]|uniref:serine hydrolase domain-containing protein n=1 Tax=Enterococcus dispar TaxID=44009 RepID=UPI002490B786|nr:serine hydrolase [Enterococcus dispar]
MKKRYWLLTSLVLVIFIIIIGWRLVKRPLPDKAKDTTTVSSILVQSNPLVKADIKQMVNKEHFKGVVLVVKNGVVINRSAYGYADFGRVKKNNIRLAYPIASLQKFMTGSLIAQLVAAGKLSYDTKLADFYPNHPELANIKIRQLLDHTSGLQMAESNPGKLLGLEEDQLNYVLSEIKVGEDQSFQYTNANYTLLSGVISQVTGEKYETVLQNKIITPLHLKRTFSWEKRPPKMTLPIAYRYEDGKDYQDDAFHADKELFSSLLGAGNLFMSIDDMLKVQEGLTNGKILTKKEYKQLAQVENAGYAGGIWHDEGLKSIHGSLGGYDTFVYGDESNRNLVILFANQPAIDGDEQLATDIYNFTVAFSNE